MEWSEILETNLNKLINDQTLFKKFQSFRSTSERVEFCLETYKSEIDNFLNKLTISDGKNVKFSDECRKKGNEFYAKKDQKTAFKLYTKSIQFAELNSKSLCLGYSNRSALFYEEKMYPQCLTDIDSAYNSYLNTKQLEPNLDNFNLIIKLLNRQKNCHFHLKQIESLKEIQEQKNSLIVLLKEKFSQEFITKLNEINKEVDEFFLNVEKNIEKIQETSKKETYLINDCMEIKYNDSKGRHLIAKRDIEQGEVLFVEKPYCAILLPEFNLDYCQRCMRLIYDINNDSFLANCFNIETCDKCVDVFYCSVECKKESQLLNEKSKRRDCFHEFECGYLTSLLHNLGVAHLAYRCVASTSLSLLKKYAQNAQEKNLMRIDYTKFDDENDYEQVFYLITHEKETHLFDLFKYALTSSLLGECFFRRSNTAISDKILITSVINRHLLQTICNAHAITQLNDNDSEKTSLTVDREQVRIATALYPRVSLLNHSCNSNVLSSFEPDSSVVLVKSSRLIKRGDEVFNCYGPHYLKMALSERLDALSEQYRFKCECDECLKQLDSLLNCNITTTGLKCVECECSKLKLGYENEGRNELDACLMIECLRCGKKCGFDEYKKVLDLILIELNEINSLDKIQSLIRKYKKLILINEKNEIESELRINEYFSSVYLNFAKLLDAEARLFCNRKKYLKAAELIEKSIKILEYVFCGDKETQSIELAHELFKLAEVRCNCGEFRKALENCERAIRIARNLYSNENLALNDFLSLRENILKILKF